MISSKKQGVNWGKSGNQEQFMREMKPKGRRRATMQSKPKSSSTGGGGDNKSSNVVAKTENADASVKRNQVNT